MFPICFASRFHGTGAGLSAVGATRTTTIRMAGGNESVRWSRWTDLLDVYHANWALSFFPYVHPAEELELLIHPRIHISG